MGRARFPFSLRWHLAAVALVALALSLLVRPLLDRMRWFDRAAYHLAQAEDCLARAEAVQEKDPDARDELLRRREWHMQLRIKYMKSGMYGHTPPDEGRP